MWYSLNVSITQADIFEPKFLKINLQIGTMDIYEQNDFNIKF